MYFLFVLLLVYLIFSFFFYLLFISTYTAHPATGTYYQSLPQTLPLTASYSTSNHLSLPGGLKSLPKTGPAGSTDASTKISNSNNNNVQNLNMSKNGINNNLINVNNNISNNMNNNSIALNATGGLQSRIISTATATANLGPHSPGPPAIPYASTDTYGTHDMNAEPGTYVHRLCSRISHLTTMHFQLSHSD